MMSADPPHTAQPAYRLDGRPVDPQAFYRAACDPARSLVVEACAGAGKTWLLVSRIVRALLAGAEPSQILAITFTRKAAGEMRERLTQWLREFAAAPREARVEALRQRGLPAADAQAQADALGALHAGLLTQGRRVEIRTFHGWFSQLLRAAPMELLQSLGLSPGVALLEDPADIAPDLYRRFHAAVRADDAAHADYVSLVRERGRSTLRRWLDAAWAKRVEVEAADAAGVLDASVPPAAEVWPAFAGLHDPAERLQSPPVRALLQGVARALGSLPGELARRHGGQLEQALSQPEPRAALQAAREALLTKDGSPRKRLDAPGLPEAIALLGDIQRAIEQQQAHHDHLRLARLARLLLAEYAALKRERGLADMADLELCGQALLHDAELSGWVQERLDLRVRHLLVDEFQDTAPLQWRALHGWLSGYAGAGGGPVPPSVFIVGDPKQSIYRFRGAEPRVFAAARDFVREALGGSVLECDHTRRNAPAVLAVVNGVFEAAGAAGEYAGFRAHTTAHAPSASEGVQLLPPPARPAREAALPRDSWRDSLAEPRHEAEETLRQREAEQVAAAVQALLADGLAPGEVFVLARRRAVLRQAALALQARQIPYAAPEDSPLMAAPEVRDLVAVLDVLASPGHDLSLAQALRSPLFGAGDDDLLWLARQSNGPGWWAALHREAADAPPALQRAAMLLAQWAAALPQLPPHDLLDRVVAEGELLTRLLAAVPPARRMAAVAAVHALLALSLQLDGARYASVYGFVRALKRRALAVAAAAQPDAVQLLTVHGAKGLEADAVLLMDSDAAPSRAETATVLVDWPVDEAQPRRVAFVASEARCPASLAGLLERERAARQREELNGLYVAMTRARERLLLSAVPAHRSGDGASWWSRVRLQVGEGALWSPPAVASASAQRQADVAVRLLPPLPRVPAAAAAATAATDERAARHGEALHRLLEWAADAPPHRRPALAEAAAAAFGLGPEAVDGLLAQAGRVLDGPAHRFFDRAALAWAGNEVTLADGEQLLRVDRLVAFDDLGGRTWWVLDYKLQPAPQRVPAYVAQLQRYRALLQRLQPDDGVRAAFVTAAGEVVELAPGDAPPRRSAPGR